MDLKTLLLTFSGNFELSVFINDEACCSDKQVSGHGTNWGEVIPCWDTLKDLPVSGIYMTLNRNYDGVAVWVDVDCPGQVGTSQNQKRDCMR